MEETLYYSARFVRPFIRLLYDHPEYRQLTFARLETVSPDERVPLSTGYASLTDAINRVSDPNIGLKAGRLLSLGAGGLLDYVMASASTVRQGIEAAGRYARLYADSLEPSIQKSDNRALLRLDTAAPWPRPVAEFAMSGWFTNHIRAQLRDAPRLECWFAHAQPPDTTEYERTFEPAKLRFGAPCYGFAFDSDHLEAPLDSADARLHVILRTQVDLILRQLPEPLDTAARVRRLLAEEISRGRYTENAREVARHLRMSYRTLSRMLEREGTTFSGEVEEIRRQLATRYVISDKIPLVQVASLLGFSCQSAFQRAFKRWTGQTPLRFRRNAIS